MLHPVQGVLCIEGIQTGDGRIWTAGALTVAPLPLPLAWLSDGDQHIDLTEMAPQIGVISSVIRQGNVLTWAGVVDDEIAAGAELLRRMRAGSAGFGERVGISIDGDDWALEVVITNPDALEVIMLASGGPGERLPTRAELRTMVAAAGQGDPGGQVLFTDAVDEMLWRFTRTRVRGATVCMVPAFAECYMEQAIVASLTVDRPTPPFPAAWFEDPNLDGPTPVTVFDDGRVAGHVAPWDTCHLGFVDRCVTAPHSETGYAHAHTRPPLPLDNGSSIRCGSITVATGHADLRLRAERAAAHYDDTGACAALVRYGEDEHGIWCAGVVNPTATDEQVWALRSSGSSGDWRRFESDFREIDGSLELISTLSVNVPAFAFPDTLAASAAGECITLIVRGISARDISIGARRRVALDALVGEGPAASVAPSGDGAGRARAAAAVVTMQRARAAAR